MKFRVDLSKPKNKGIVTYNKAEHSFDFQPLKSADTSILVDYINIDINASSKELRQVWGFCTWEGWQKKELHLPNYSSGAILYEAKLIPGVSERIPDSENWAKYYDEASGWVCIGEERTQTNDIAVEFADHTIAVLQDGNLKALWIKPVWE